MNTQQQSSKQVFAVRSGRTCGLFNDTDSLLKSIIGFKCAEFNAFDSIEAADKYIYDYCCLYQCSPPVAPGCSIIHVFSKEFDVGDKKKRFVAVSSLREPNVEVGTREDGISQCDAVYDRLMKLEDKEDQVLLVGGERAVGTATGVKMYPINYVVGGLARLEACLEEKKVEQYEDLKGESAMQQYVFDETFKVLCAIASENDKRKHKVAIKSSQPINALYAVRILTHQTSVALEAFAEKLNSNQAGATTTGSAAADVLHRDT